MAMMMMMTTAIGCAASCESDRANGHENGICGFENDRENATSVRADRDCDCVCDVALRVSHSYRTAIY